MRYLGLLQEVMIFLVALLTTAIFMKNEKKENIRKAMAKYLNPIRDAILISQNDEGKTETKAGS